MKLGLLLLATAASAMWPFNGRLPLQADPLADVAELVSKGQYEQALDHMDDALNRRGLSSKDKVRAYLLFGRSLEALGRYDRALTHYVLALQLYPRDEELTLALADVYHREELDDKARPLYERVLSRDSRNPRAHIGLAESYQSLGLYDSALEHYRQAVEAWGAGNPIVWTNYAHALAGERDFAGAEHAMQKALSLSSSPERLEDLAVYQHAQGKLEQAYVTLDAAIAAASSDASLRLRRALWLSKEGRDEEAARDVEKALQLQPKDPLGWWCRGLLDARAGRTADARLAFQSAAAVGKGFVAKAAKAALRTLSK
jgi:tetratricopeptide (TPR) repeat protein